MPLRRLPDRPMGRGIYLDRNQLKYIAIMAMLLDHVAAIFMPPESFMYQFLRMLGRCTGPIMAYFIAEGMLHTSDEEAYLRRLGAFALLSWPTYTLAFVGHLPVYREGGAWMLDPTQGVIASFWLGAMAIKYWKDPRLSHDGRVVRVILLCVLSLICDHAVVGVLWPLWFYLYRDDLDRKWGLYCLGVAFLWMALWEGPATTAYLVGYAFPMGLLARYDGTKGSGGNRFFYWFYPGHLLALGLIRMFVAWRLGL